MMKLSLKELINSEGVKGTAFKTWFDLSLSFAKSLPPKK